MLLPNDWKDVLEDELKKDYFIKMSTFLELAYKTKTVYPKQEHIFSAFLLTPYNNVKVVIIGQDPYHQSGQAHGLSFSVQNGVKPPPSLKNIYKELNTDLNCEITGCGNLEKWAKQGVLLLNTVLTVEEGKPTSHKNLGWDTFTKKVIEVLNCKNEPIVFLLWGNFAKTYKTLIDTNKHYVLQAAHPSPFSAYNGFFGCKHFSKTNELLKQLNKTPIDWQIEEENKTLIKQFI
ncbi:MAG: uracil-DNA glycosylase [Tenericutes bacterium HGW-Tenericutes-4]|jgi:uracil-DNA glycosylase|nr:MAG: uracil-DNA glycosylase [Tenericutes bacterium HGW-Tenericutes-4]